MQSAYFTQRLQRSLKLILQTGIEQGGKYLLSEWFQLTAGGTQMLPKPPYILASNHTSHLDGPAIIAAHPHPLSEIYSLAAQDYFFDHPVKSFCVRTLFNLVPFNRQNCFHDCLPLCRQLVEQGNILLMFPEGTRSSNGQLQPFKRGLGFLAHTLSIPIIPVCVIGSYQALPKGNRQRPNPHPIQVQFGQPIFPSSDLAVKAGNRRQYYSAMVEDVRCAIAQLQSVPEQNLRSALSS